MDASRTTERPAAEAPSEPGRRAAFFWPLVIFVALAAMLGIGLKLDPRELPSPLIDRPVPQFRLPAVQGRTLGLASKDLRGEVSVVNVFASWCTACRDEHPLWMQIARQRTVPIHGLNYKDAPVEGLRLTARKRECGAARAGKPTSGLREL